MRSDNLFRRSRVRVRWFLPTAALLVGAAAPALGQLRDQATAVTSAASSPVEYRISATLTDYCAVERSLPLHYLAFDFHNASCQSGSQVSETKTPTLPRGPFYRDVHIAGYRWVDWSEGHSSPSARHTASVEISKTAITLSASGWLGPASCSKASSGDGPVLVEDTFWQAKLVPEVQFIEDVEHQEQPVTAELVAPETTAVLTLSAGCADARDQSLQYSVTPVVNGVAGPSTYTSPVQKAGKAAIESDATLEGASIHARWNSKTSGDNNELTLTIVQSGAQAEAAHHSQ
jgi:hypothetical protein